MCLASAFTCECLYLSAFYVLFWLSTPYTHPTTVCMRVLHLAPIMIMTRRAKHIMAGRDKEAAAVRRQNDQNYLSDKSLEYVVKRLPMTNAVSRR